MNISGILSNKGSNINPVFSLTDNISGTPVWMVLLLCFLIVATAFFLIMFMLAKKSAGSSGFDQNDELTGLGNKRFMRSCYERRISSCRDSYCLAYLAFEYSKAERALGTEKCTTLQKYIAKVLVEVAGEFDYSSRIDNGVFVFCFRFADTIRASQMISQITDIVNNFQYKSFNEIHAPLKAGIYALGKKKEDFESALSNAKLGYKHACEISVNICVCTQELIGKEQSHNRLKDKLSRAIDHDEFEVFLQFIHDTKEQRFIGAEVLSRWNNPEEGFLTPAHYIKDMRTTGIIVKFDYYIIDKTCRLLEHWKKTGYSDLSLSCNITRITISEENFLQVLRSIVQKYDFDHSRLILEITEDAFIDNRAVAYRNIVDCKKEGFLIAIDDFGAGHSSFSDLCDYPVDIIKVDRQLTIKTATKRGNSLLQGLIKLSHDLNIGVVCEGVETEEQKETVEKDECDFIQGYYYSYVFPIDEGMEYFEKSLEKEEK